jgi:hypothetical protein
MVGKEVALMVVAIRQEAVIINLKQTFICKKIKEEISTTIR